MVNYKLAEEEYKNSNIGVRELCRKYKLNRQVLTGWLMAKGFFIENRRAFDKSNIHIFDKIDTEEKAYWLGFIFADGCIMKSDTSYKFELSLSIKDTKHLEKFRVFAKVKTELKINNIRCRCNIYSKHLFNTLNSYKCTPKKSLTLEFPDESVFKNKELIKHFIRGYIDGDGCISYSNKNHSRMELSLLGTYSFLNKIQEYLPIERKNKIQIDSRRGTFYSIQFSGKTGYKICDYLYKNSNIHLDRKYKRYKEYKTLYESK